MQGCSLKGHFLENDVEQFENPCPLLQPTETIYDYNMYNESYLEKYLQMKTQREKLKNELNLNIVVMNECIWREAKISDNNVILFMDQYFENRERTRMIPR